LVLLAAAGCSGPGAAPRCISDAECSEGLICFEDGCGDPTRGLGVEIKGGSTSGLFPQDFEVPSLGKSQDFEIRGALTIVGSFQREKTAVVDPTQRSIYTDPVVVRATGESVLLPGVTRSYQASFVMTDRGTYTMTVGQGRFTVTALPESPEVPPQSFTNVVASPDAGATVNFAFPSLEGSISVAGRLIKRRVTLPVPSEEYLTAPVDLQAIDPLTQEPLSARVETSTARGDFILVISPKARQLSSIELVATPRVSNGPLLPTRRFPLAVPFPSTLTLELGEFGSKISDVRGSVVGIDGQPLVGATVYLEGKVGNGANFRANPVTTDESGSFLIDVLPPDDTFTVTVFPRSGTASAVTTARLKVKSEVGAKPVFDPGVIRCGQRITVTGTALLPDGMPASNLTVRAIESASSLRPLPLDEVEVLTDVNGTYELLLDMGNWRLEFVPATELPHTSRLITVTQSAAIDGGASTRQVFAPVTLPKGRRLTGIVTSTTANRLAVPLANAQVRFFRLTRIEGKPAAVLIGSGVTNGVGQYTVVLPTR
jgi:hypothetical protein